MRFYYYVLIYQYIRKMDDSFIRKFETVVSKASPQQLEKLQSIIDKKRIELSKRRYRSKYECDISSVRETVEKYGVAIVPNLLDEDECESMVSGMWDYFEHVTSEWDNPIDRNDTDTWKEIYKLYPSHSMLFQYFGVGHAQCVWDLRQNPKIVEVFAKIWNCKKDELLVSFDGLSFCLPPEETNRGWNRNQTWFHTDQSYTRNEMECIQSWVTGLDVNKGDATLSIMEKSHKYHAEFAKKFGITDKKDWYKLNEKEEQFYIDKGCSYKKIVCPKGSLVLWDSRTIHCGAQPDKTRETKNIRAVVYLCYTPRTLANDAKLKKKIHVFEELRMTSHWPHKVTMFGKNPRTYGGELPTITQIPQPKLNKLGKKLAGY